MDESEAQLRAEYEALARRANLTIPPERDAHFFESFKDFRRALARLHAPRSAAVEVASVFTPERAGRGAPVRGGAK